MQHNTLPKHDQKMPFTRYDFGWVLYMHKGMAIGAGTVADASTNWLEGSLGILLPRRSLLILPPG